MEPEQCSFGSPSPQRSRYSMREDRKIGLTFGVLLALMMLAVELVGWKRAVLLWALLFAGSLVVKLIRLVLP